MNTFEDTKQLITLLKAGVSPFHFRQATVIICRCSTRPLRLSPSGKN